MEFVGSCVLVPLIAALALAACASQRGSTTVEDTRTAMQTGYANVNGLRVYYEIHGEARAGTVPLVLLHGGGSTLDTSFGRTLPGLARTRRVIAFDQQGHGRTADVDRPFTFEQSADDTAALLTHLRVERADLYGFSNGANIALEVAIRHPALVRKMVLGSGLVSRDGVDPSFWDFMRDAQLANMPLELREEYQRVSPHPEKLQEFHDKSAQRMRDFRDVPVETLRALTAPSLVLVGDRDVPRPEHAVAMYRLLPKSQLAILPGADHGMVVQRADWVVSMIENFLDAPDER